MALLLIAITTGITVTMLRYQRLDITRTRLMITSEQAYLYAQGVVDWAIVALKLDLSIPNKKTIWPMLLPPTQIADGQGKVSGLMEQAEGRLNINNLSSSFETKKEEDTQNEREILLKLISILEPQQNADGIQNLLNAIAAWTSSTQPSEPTGMDNYDNQYSLLKPSYRSPHQPMVSISELRTVNGMTASLYQKLLPHLIALPEKTNIDTTYAPAILLQAMGLPPNGAKKSDTESQKNNTYFLLRVDVNLNQQHFILYSLLKRDFTDKTKSTITQLWQSFGTT